MQYLAAFRNEKNHPPVAQLFSDDEEGAIRAFIERYDRPGLAVYRCVSSLDEGTSQRNLGTVTEISRLCVDIDVLNDLEESIEEATTKLLHLPLQPTVVRYSGGGFHAVFELKEPIPRGTPEFDQACDLLKRLTRCLSGDPMPAHPAALLREVGTHNTKRGEPVLVEAVWGSGEPVDISEIEALVDLLPDEGIFTRKQKANGRDHTPPAAASQGTDRRRPAPGRCPVRGAGESKVGVTELQVSASLLGKGLVQETVDTLLDELRVSLADDPRVASWDWEASACRLKSFVIRGSRNTRIFPIDCPMGCARILSLSTSRAAARSLGIARDLGWYVASRAGAGTAKLKRLAKERGEAPASEGTPPRLRQGVRFASGGSSPSTLCPCPRADGFTGGTTSAA